MTITIQFGQRLTAATGDIRATAFLFQRLSVNIQRHNSVLIYESFGDLELEPDLYSHSSHLFYFCFSHLVLYTLEHLNNK